jgi:nickel-dependent lactate racemase
MEQVSVVVATGIHRSPTSTEMHAILGEDAMTLLGERIFVHDARDEAGLVAVGTTAQGQCVSLNRRYVEADRRILLGTVTYHYHAGFGGGRKSIVPGLADYATIAYTHSRSLDPDADRMHPDVVPGTLKGNPVAEALSACAELCPPDIIVNTVLLSSGGLVGVVAGDMQAAHGAACQLARRVYRVDIASPADIVVASAGTAPNWIQSHKALFNAHRAVAPGGWIVLDAPCPEGLGNERFRHWLTRPDLATLYRELRASPEVNGQTALSTRLRGERTVLVTGMAAQETAELGIRTAATMTRAIEQVLAELAGRDLTYYVMPDARYPVPFVGEVHSS